MTLMMNDDRASLDQMLTMLRSLRGAAAPASAPSQTGPAPAKADQPARDDQANHEGAELLLALLRDRAGFRSTPALQRKLAQVLRHVSPEEIGELAARVKSGQGEADLWSIVEDLTNHETFFFRDVMQLDPISDVLLPEAIEFRARRDRHLRLWSAACATGEEAYTLTFMALEALRKAGHANFSEQRGYELRDGWQLSVLGTDISRQAIRIARDATYQESSFGSFRQMPEGWRQFFLERSTGPNRYGQQAAYLTPLPSILRHVRFETFNLVSRNPPILDCDLVLCRNVLIYIDIARQADIISMISRAIRPQGIFVPSLVDQVGGKLLKPRWLNRCAFYEKR